MVVVSKMRKKSVSKFLGQFKSKNTEKSYRTTLRQFFDFIYPGEDLDEASLKYITQDLDHDFEGDLVRFRDEFLKSKSPSTRGLKLTVIFRYLKVNDLEFDDQWKKNIIGSKERISKERVPEPDQLRRIVYHLPVQGKAYYLILATGGMRSDEGLQLNISDLELDYIARYLGEDRKMKEVPIPKINIRAETTKTKKGRITFITTEAKIELERWLTYRDQYIENQKSRGMSKDFLREVEEGRLFPFGLGTVRSMWTTALKKVGLYERDQRTGRLTLRPHNLRKFFRTWGGWPNPDLAECLMGHQQGLNAIYARPDQALRLLVEGYKEAEPNLTLTDQPIIEVPTEDIKELKNWNTQLRLEILELKEDQRKVAEQMGRFASFIEMLGYDWDPESGKVGYDPERDRRRE